MDLGADPARAAQEAEQHQRLTVTEPTGAERAAMLADLDATHRRVTERFSALDAATFTRQAAVIYPWRRALPDLGADILGWLTDHYDEHVGRPRNCSTSGSRSAPVAPQ